MAISFVKSGLTYIEEQCYGILIMQQLKIQQNLADH